MYFLPYNGNIYASIGTGTANNLFYDDEIPLGSWCNGGTFKINSQTDSTNTNCYNMSL